MNKKHPCEEPVRQRAGDFFKKHDPKGKTAEEDQYFFRFRRERNAVFRKRKES